MVARLDTEPDLLGTVLASGRGILHLFEQYLVPCRTWYDTASLLVEGRDGKGKLVWAGILCTPGKIPLSSTASVSRSQFPGIEVAQSWFDHNFRALVALQVLEPNKASTDYHPVDVILLYCLFRSSGPGVYYLSSRRLRESLTGSASSSPASSTPASPDSSSSALSASASVGSGSSSSSKRVRVSSSSSPPTTTTSRRVRAPPDRYGSSSSNFTNLTRDSDDEPLGSKKGRSKAEGRKKRRISKVGSEFSSISNSSSSSSSSSGSSSGGTTSRSEEEEKGDKEEGLDPAGFLQAVAPNFGLDFLNTFNRTIAAMDRLRSWVRGFAQSHQALDRYRSQLERERETVRFQQAESDKYSERLIRERNEVEHSKKQLEEEKAKYNVPSLISVLLEKENKIRELELKIGRCTCNVNCKPGQEPRRDDSQDPGATPVST